MKFFQQSHKTLAKALTGRKMMVGKKEVEILKAQGFPRKENEAPLYVPILTKKPGEVYCPRLRGGLLVLVACLDGQSAGGCVLIRKVKIKDQVIDGPGRVAEALGIEQHAATGNIAETRGNLVLEMD